MTDRLQDLKKKFLKKSLNYFCFWGEVALFLRGLEKNRMGGDKIHTYKIHTYGRTWWLTDHLGPEGQVGENFMFIFVKHHNWKIFSKNVDNCKDVFYSRVFNCYKSKITKSLNKFSFSVFEFFLIFRLCIAWTLMIEFNKLNVKKNIYSKVKKSYLEKKFQECCYLKKKLV